MVDRRLIIAAVVALLVVAFVVGDRRAGDRAAPSTSRPAGVPAATVQPRSTPGAVVAAASTSAESTSAAAASPAGSPETSTTPGAPALRSFDLDCPTTSPVDGGTGPPSVPADCSPMVCTQMPPTPDDRGEISCVGRSTTATTAPTATTVPTATTAPTAPGTGGADGRLFANTGDLGLYAVNAGGDGRAVRIDLDSGAVAPAPEHSAGNGTIVAVTGTGASARALTMNDVDGVVVAPCSDGTYWSLGVDNTSSIRPDYSEPVLRHIAVHPGSATVVLQKLDVSSVLSNVSADDLLATTADDKPVIRGPNGQGYIVDPATGALQRLTTGRLVDIYHGAYSEIVCDGTARCAVVLHGASSTTVSLVGESQLATSFGPDGSHALVTAAASGSGIRMVDMASGTVTEIEGARGPVDAAGTRPQGSSSVWTPDGSTVMSIVGDHLLRIDALSNVATSFDLPAPLDRSWRLVAIA